MILTSNSEVLIVLACRDKLLACHNERSECRSRFLILNGIGAYSRRIALCIVVIALHNDREHASSLVVFCIHSSSNALLVVRNLRLVSIIHRINCVVVAILSEFLVQCYSLAFVVGCGQRLKSVIIDELEVVKVELVVLRCTWHGVGCSRSKEILLTTLVASVAELACELGPI